MKRSRNKYEEIIRQNNEKKKQELIQKLKEQEESYNPKQFQSKYLDRVIENELLTKEQKIEEEERLREYHEKMKEYDETIKRKYGPVTSRKKQEELEKIKKELAMNPRDKVRRSSPLIHSDKEDLREIALKRKQIFEWKNPLKPPTPAPKKEFERVNFLREFQQELQEEFERTGKKPIPVNRNWQQDLRTDKLSSTEKFQSVRQKADQIAQSANQKRKFLSMNGGGTAQEMSEVNDMLFDSLNAKLSLLQTAVQKDR